MADRPTPFPDRTPIYLRVVYHMAECWKLLPIVYHALYVTPYYGPAGKNTGPFQVRYVVRYADGRIQDDYICWFADFPGAKYYVDTCVRQISDQ